ncbi:hypothetical protein ACFYXP_38820 [Streptomyces sp. NPDC002466]|uniref:hypothetical protein n=1 Tax=unclassified Streptomyces TaxID=2593676 RepID=UPI00332E4FF7
MIFKVIGDAHPGTHFLGYVKYYPDDRGDRTLFGRTYRQNSIVSKAFGILADRPECYIYSPTVGCVITGVPHEDIVTHCSCRQTLAALHQPPDSWTPQRLARTCSPSSTGSSRPRPRTSSA